jgi:hypothetical protein
MSAKEIYDRLKKDFIGTYAELSSVIIIDLAVGSTYWAHDTKKAYIWTGTDWKEV